MNRLFDSEWYLQRNVDVATAVKLGQTDAWSHYHDYGRFEGRSPSHFFDPAHYLVHNPDIRAAVEAGLVTAYDHFLMYGIAEARSFVPYFDVNFYLQHNPDVNTAVDGDRHAALQHFLLHGHAEGRPISPFFDMGAYLQANPDLAALEKHGGNPLLHLLFHGHGEERPLGNGIHLAQFANDVKFQIAATPFEKLARIAEVGPFLPTFNPPPGWEAPEDTPIPIDFIPIPGEKLVVPPSVKIPDGMELPDTFEPVNPGPGPGPSPDPGPGPGPEPGPGESFQAYMGDDGVIRFKNVRDGEVELVRYLDDWLSDASFLEFSSGTETSLVKVVDSCGCADPDDLTFPIDDDALLGPWRVELQNGETMVGQPLLLSLIAINQVQMVGAAMSPDPSRASIRVDGRDTPAPEGHLAFENAVALVASSLKDGVETLNLDMQDSTVIMAPYKEYHLLAYDDVPGVDAVPKSLNLQVSGDANFLYLSGRLADDMSEADLEEHVHVGEINIAGEGELALMGPSFGRAGTTLDASGSSADVALIATLYNGIEHGAEYDWNIRFGDGNDILIIEADGTEPNDLQPYPGKHGSFIDGGGGDANRLNLDADAYERWATPDSDAIPDGTPIVSNFQVLVTVAVDDRKYESTLLGNPFDSIELHSATSSPDVTIGQGFSSVTMFGGFTLDVAELQDDAIIHLKSYDDYSHFGDMEHLKNMFWDGGFDYDPDADAEEATIKIAALDEELDGSNVITIALSDSMDVTTLTLENGRINFEGGVITAQNFLIDVGAAGITEIGQLRDAVIDIEVTLGDTEPYTTFEIQFGRSGADPEFTLILENFVSASQYDDMRDSLGLGSDDDDIALAQILITEYTEPDGGGLFLI